MLTTNDPKTDILPPAWVLSFLDEQCPQPIVAVVNLIRTARLFEKSFNDFLEPFGMTGPQCELLFLLNCHGKETGLSLTELGEWQGVSKANMTGMIDRMEREGLVIREKHLHDRRLTMVKPTAKGSELIEVVKIPHEMHMEGLFSCLTSEEHTQLIRLLTRLRQKLGD